MQGQDIDPLSFFLGRFQVLCSLERKKSMIILIPTITTRNDHHLLDGSLSSCIILNDQTTPDQTMMIINRPEKRMGPVIALSDGSGSCLCRYGVIIPQQSGRAQASGHKKPRTDWPAFVSCERIGLGFDEVVRSPLIAASISVRQL